MVLGEDMAGCWLLRGGGERDRSEIGVPGERGGVEEGVLGILVSGPFDFWGGGERVKSAGEPEGRMGELWGSPRPMIGSTMSGKLGFTRLRAIGAGRGV